MTRRLISSDWQLTDNPRDRYRTDWVVNELPKLIDKYKPDQLLMLGDLTESKDSHPASLVNEIVNLFHNLQKQCYVIILEGNHDFLHKEHPYFKFISKFDNVEWISKPMVLDGCLYLPHTRDYKKDWKGIDFNGHDFILAHNIFEGVKANGQALSGIPLSIFLESAFVISGDVHEPQTIGPVTYVGSPTLCDFGDSYQPRVLLLDGLDVKSIKVHGPQKRVVEVFWKEGMQFRRVGDFNPGDIVKVKSHLEMDHVAHWARLRDHLANWLTEQGAIVNTIQPIVSYAQGERAKPVQGEQKSDVQYLDAFIKRSGIDDRTAVVGKDLLGD